jgi:cell division protein FtsA
MSNSLVADAVVAPARNGNDAPRRPGQFRGQRHWPARPRGSTIAAIDIGTAKICCLIARVEAAAPRILGVGNRISRGVRAGTIIDLDAAGASIRDAVHAGEQMAGETIERAVVNLSGGYAASRTVAEIELGRREIGESDLRQVLERGYRLRDAPDRQVIHSIPLGFSIDDRRGILDPRGMVGERLGVAMHIVTAAAASVRNHSAAVGRSHLETEALVVSPYAAGLACLVEDETNLGVTIIDMGGGTTTIGIFFGGNLTFADAVPVGGIHVTNDIARGLSTPVAQAERLKALFGSAISSTLDEREMILVPEIGEAEAGHVNRVPKSLLVDIIAPRLEETFELVRSRLEASGCEQLAGQRVVLTGGACQLHGVRELAGLILDKQIRVGRPMGVIGLPEAAHGPAFSTAAGLLLFAASEHAESLQPSGIAPGGIFSRVGQWLREHL